jgi:hypothetical protein
MVVCAVVAEVSSLSLCQPPTPRVPKGEPSGNAFISLTVPTSKDFLPAFDRVKQAVQVHNLDGLPSLDVMR